MASAEVACLDRLQELGKLHKYLPAEISEAFYAEGIAREIRLLQLLSSDPAPPSPSELSFGLRCLRSFYDQQFETTIEFKASICRALWRLFIAAATASDLYSYSLRSKLVEQLALWLKELGDVHVPEHWQDIAPEEGLAKILDELRQELDIRLPVRLLIDEMGMSPRVDLSVSTSKPRTFVIHLVHLCSVMTRFLDVSTGAWLTSDVASKLTESHSYTMLYARLLVLLTPMSCVPQFVLDGQLWTWWSSMPEGLVPKFDLMWFALISRYAEMHWTNKIEDALATTGSTGRSSDCHNALVNQYPWLMNKMCRTLALPFGSPAANAVDGNKKQSPPELDRYAIPEEIDQVVMGQRSTWKDVAKFIIYMLEASPPEQITNNNAWSLLIILHRRMKPFLVPSHSSGEWAWHCSTFLRFLVFHYHKRISRERLVANKVPSSNHLTQAADQKFVELMMPFTRDLMYGGHYEIAASMENLSRLAQIAALTSPPSTGMELMEGPSDAFKVDMPALMFKAAEVLNDPGQSDRHVPLLNMCVMALPALLLHLPSAIGGLLPISLLGIDATDTAKTLTSINMLISIFSRVPCLNSNDWSVSGGDVESNKAAWRWPAAKGCQLLNGGMPDGGVAIISSMLPTFAVQLIDHFLDYVTKLPKPAKKGGEYQNSTMGMMHGVVCLIASQCDKVTYEQIVKSVAQFVETTLLPNQVKPAGLLVSAVVRSDPDTSLPILMPVLFKKLLKPLGSNKVPFHEAGVSDSEAKWGLSMLASTIRPGGSRLLTYRTDIETIIRSALLDERESVGKLGLKVLRRVLCSISMVYIDNDHRLCSAAHWNKLLAARLGSATPEVAAPLSWSGPISPWWASEKSSLSVSWHVPSEQEVAWARELSLGVLLQVGKLLETIPVANLPSLNPGSIPTSWLDGLSSSLPEKRKSSHAAVLAMRMAGSVLRGTSELWPDEREEAELKERHIPRNLAIAGNTGRLIYEWLGDALVVTFKCLVAQEQQTSDVSSTLDAIEVSRVIRKMLKCIGEYIGGLREYHPSGQQLFPNSKHGDVQAFAMQYAHKSVMEGLHHNSRWRDQARVWWVERAGDAYAGWAHDRIGGHRFSGRRRELMEIMCREAIHSSFSVVRACSTDILMKSIRYHVGCRWALARDVLLPALATETQAALRCDSLSGDAADKEQQRLNDALSGLAVSLGGGLHGLMAGIWRRGVDDAAKVGLALCETIYASTKKTSRPATQNGTEDKKCEVKSGTVQQIIAAVKHWLDCRESECSGTSRPRSKVPELEEDDLAVESDAKAAKGMAALEVVGKALDVCEREDCHWRAQVVATSVSLALLNAFGASGVPHGCVAPEQIELAKSTWTRWGQWLVKCIEPKGQPGLHSLGVHALLLLLKRPAPLDDSMIKKLGIDDPSFMQKLVEVVPRLHHAGLMSGDQGTASLEPTETVVASSTHAGYFKLWPQSWVRRSSKAFSLRNALFWQSYTRFLSRSCAPESVVEILRKGMEHLASQPTSEPEWHAALTELAAGCFRALRKPDEASSHLRQQVWTQLHSCLLAEVQQSSQERLEDWCDATRFIVTGCRRSLLKTTAKDSDESCKFLYPLLNFVLGGDADLKFDSLSHSLPPIHFDYSGDASMENGKGGSSFDIYKRLRLLMSLLVEPSATNFIQKDQAFCKKLVELLQGGLGHPYKQLREEIARAIFFVLRSAGDKSTGDTGLKTVLVELEDWLCAEASRLLPLLQKDNAAHVKESDDNARPRHVVESSGLCYTLLHAALARMTSRYYGKAGPASLTFLLAASAHGDFELRVLAAHALSLCCSAHPLGPDAAQKSPWAAMPMATALTQALCSPDALTDKELEKAYSSAFKPIIMANFFLLSTHDASQGMLAKLREASEQALGHSKPEVRNAARSAVVSFLALDAEAQVTSHLTRFKKLAGPARKATSSEVIVLDSENSLSIGVGGLTCALLAAADCGVPRWTGKAVQAVAPYGRPGLPEGVRKEVQGAIQAFLKLQQSNQRNWKEFQEKMTPSQLELLDDGKGKLSYFS